MVNKWKSRNLSGNQNYNELITFRNYWKIESEQCEWYTIVNCIFYAKFWRINLLPFPNENFLLEKMSFELNEDLHCNQRGWGCFSEKVNIKFILWNFQIRSNFGVSSVWFCLQVISLHSMNSKFVAIFENWVLNNHI